MNDACCDLVQDLNSISPNIKEINETIKTASPKKDSPQIYDIFVSYSHRNPEFAKAIVELIGMKYPNLNVFFDRSELKSG